MLKMGFRILESLHSDPTGLSLYIVRVKMDCENPKKFYDMYDPFDVIFSKTCEIQTQYWPKNILTKL